MEHEPAHTNSWLFISNSKSYMTVWEVRYYMIYGNSQEKKKKKKGEISNYLKTVYPLNTTVYVTIPLSKILHIKYIRHTH